MLCRCVVCGNDFKTDRVNGYCSKECRTKSKYLSHRESIIEKDEKWGENNIEEVKAKRRELYLKNPELYREQARKWRAENRAKYLETQNNYHDKDRFSGNKIKVLERDNYKCVKCGNTENLIVHHLDESGQGENPNNELDNLTTLCRSCHMAIHELETQHKKRIKVNCLYCGREFETVASRIKSGRGLHCSMECKGLSSRSENITQYSLRKQELLKKQECHVGDTRIRKPCDVVCVVCGETFEAKAKRAKYCGEDCRKKAYSKIVIHTEKICPICNKAFLPEQSQKQVYCSDVCHNKAFYQQNTEKIKANVRKWKQRQKDIRNNTDLD